MVGRWADAGAPQMQAPWQIFWMSWRLESAIDVHTTSPAVLTGHQQLYVCHVQEWCPASPMLFFLDWSLSCTTPQLNSL